MNKDVIIFSGALIDSPLWTNRQHVALRLAKRGWRVLYVEPRLFLLKMLLGNFPGKMGKAAWFWRSNVPSKFSDNLWVVSQFNVLPKSREFAAISTINHWLNKFSIKIHAYFLGFKNPAILIYDTEAAQYLKEFPYSTIIYDCVDDHRAQAGVSRNSSLVAREEKAIAVRADAISVTTEILLERFQKLNENVFLNPNAADIDRFLECGEEEPDDMKIIPHPRIGVVGAIDDYKIDIDLLKEVAQAKTDWYFVLIGPVDYAAIQNQKNDPSKDKTNINELNDLPNIHFLGQREYDIVPKYVTSFDVAMIPYKKSAYNDSSFPLKFWEFMASGKPIVATGATPLKKFQFLFEWAESKEEFIRAIENALNDTPEKETLRVNEAKKHDWRRRVDVLEKLLSN